MCDAINTAKSEVKDPYLIIAGDFNKFPLEDALEHYDDVQILVTPPLER